MTIDLLDLMRATCAPPRSSATCRDRVAAILIALPFVGVQVDPGLPDAVENVIYAAGAVGAIVAPLLQAEITRRKVYSPATVDEVVAETKAQAQVQRIDQRRHPRTALDPDGDGSGTSDTARAA